MIRCTKCSKGQEHGGSPHKILVARDDETNVPCQTMWFPGRPCYYHLPVTTRAMMDGHGASGQPREGKGKTH
ncbi:hypothetical protein E2C01_061108 [Portunus trituberculatus]|uniref:Uncharacterized protein n=1 Tax=Portunus trituberculatus TaxID=210409 RepID=A0A5B7HAT4_PORTR|nr:hypothetical protein [Portunus trituberculatus]